jgi:hypothetical protein
MPNDTITHLAKLCDDATEGPWYRDIHYHGSYFARGPWHGEADGMEPSKRDAAFIASARTAMPALVECLGEMEKLADHLESKHDAEQSTMTRTHVDGAYQYGYTTAMYDAYKSIREIISRHLSGIEVAK